MVTLVNFETLHTMRVGQYWLEANEIPEGYTNIQDLSAEVLYEKLKVIRDGYSVEDINPTSARIDMLQVHRERWDAVKAVIRLLVEKNPHAKQLEITVK